MKSDIARRPPAFPVHHTTVLPRPYLAVQRVELAAANHSRNPKRVEVGIWQRNRERGRLRQPPRTVSAPTRLRSQVLAHASSKQFGLAC